MAPRIMVCKEMSTSVSVQRHEQLGRSMQTMAEPGHARTGATCHNTITWHKSAVAAALIRMRTRCLDVESIRRRLLCRVPFSGDPEWIKSDRKEHPRGAVHCEWAILVIRGSLHGPVTGPPTRSPEVPGFGAMRRSRVSLPTHDALRGEIQPHRRARPVDALGLSGPRHRVFLWHGRVAESKADPRQGHHGGTMNVPGNRTHCCRAIEPRSAWSAGRAGGRA